MPPVDETAVAEDEAPASKPKIGIIYPPPEVRNIVDKTASFVARNGPEFETRIRQNELNNPKFNFLNLSDPYYAYYQHKVKEFEEGKAQELAPFKPLPTIIPQKLLVEPIKVVEPIAPKDPPPEFEFIADPPSISAFDLDVVKLTAQFVARNGRQFLTNLMNREQRNYQFDFLRPQHSLFTYFTKLVEQYTKILIPPKDLLPKLKKEAENPKQILDQVRYRVEWEKFEERKRQKEAEEKEKERVAYAQIEWHDFVVVETVDFQPNEQGNLPPPTNPDEVGARVLAQERFKDNPQEAVEMEVSDEEDEAIEEDEEDEDEPVKEAAPLPPPPPAHKPPAPPPQRGDDTQVLDMEEDSSEEEDEDKEEEKKQEVPAMAPPPPPPPPKDIPQPPPLPPVPEQVIVRKDYDPKAPKVLPSEPASDQYLVSPITEEKIPADKIQEHMRIGLLDPKWIDQRDRAMREKHDQEEVYASGSAIDSSLKRLAERRTDIFGAGTEEAQIGKKIGEEEKKKEHKVIWDGHTASMEKVTQKARENISIEEQIKVIHKVKGLVDDEEKEKIGPARPKAPPPSSIPPTSIALPPPLPPSAKPPGGRPPSSMSSKLPPATTSAAHIPPPPPKVGMPPIQSVPMPQRPPIMVMGPPPGLRHGPVVNLRPPGGPMPPMMGGQMPPRPGFIPGPPMPGPMVPRQRPPMPPQSMDDEPPSKKAKTEEQLIPEEDFLLHNKGPVTFRVHIPRMPDKSEWKLLGQMMTLTLPLTDSVSVIKAKLHEGLGMPAGKQKLQLDGIFIKDSNTLAYYNFTRGSVVQLQVKERGGRKK